MNIALFVSELEDSEVKRICVGAIKAAKDNGVSLCIIPGGYLETQELYKSSTSPSAKEDDNKNYDYQQSAAFEYILFRLSFFCCYFVARNT